MSARVTLSGGACPPHGSGIATGAARFLMPATTALISSRDVHACATGVSPLTIVVPARPAVMTRLASHTSRVIRGMPRKVPTITGPAVFSRARMPRTRSFGGGSGMSGSPVRPLRSLADGSSRKKRMMTIASRLSAARRRGASELGRAVAPLGYRAVPAWSWACRSLPSSR